MKRQNKWEKLFDEFLDLTEFSLVKNQNNYNKATDEYGCWSLIDKQGGNIGNIEGDRFECAKQIFDRMENYIEDYIAEPLEKELINKGNVGEEFYSLEDILFCRKELPDSQWDFDVLDMICYRFEEINLENCNYKEVTVCTR